jgi:hypothetical protein
MLQDDEFERLSTQSLEEILDKGLLLERGRSLFELARRSGEDKELIKKVVNEISNPKNISSKTVGMVSLSFLGMAGLLGANTELTRSAARSLFEIWPESNRGNLVDFLTSASLVKNLMG